MQILPKLVSVNETDLDTFLIYDTHAPNVINSPHCTDDSYTNFVLSTSFRGVGSYLKLGGQVVMRRAAAAFYSAQTSVMRVGSDTFGDPIFQKGLQNYPSSGIMSVLGCFA